MTEIWNLNALCRCCHADGSFSNINSPCNIMGSKELFSDLLKDTFGIQIHSPPLEVSYMICDTCIKHLQDGAIFKKRIMECELKFQEYCRNELLQHEDIKLENDIEDNGFIIKTESALKDGDNDLIANNEVSEDEDNDLIANNEVSDDEENMLDYNRHSPGLESTKNSESNSTKSSLDSVPGSLPLINPDTSLNYLINMNAYEIFEFLESDARHSKNTKKRRRMMLRRDWNPFHLSESEFVKRYRLTKPLVHKLCDELRPLMKDTKKSTDLSVETKVLIALSFYATGSYQCSIGNNEGHFVAQQTVSSVIAQVTNCLNTQEMREKYIKFPMTGEERNRVKAEFYRKFRIPGVLGCIGCTQVAIIRPAHDEERFYCRKHYHALNVQLICDAEMQIISVDASHGGASHESFIWTNHPLRTHLEELSNSDSIWLLGDSGYPLRETMMTPILEAAPGSPEEHYTNLHVRASNIIEHTIGLLKARFRCLLVHRALRYSPQVAGSIINACVILHNICNRAKTSVQQLSDEDVLEESRLRVNNALSEQPHGSDMTLEQGITSRNLLVQLLWERRNLAS